MADAPRLDADHRVLTEDLDSRDYMAQMRRILAAAQAAKGEMARDGLFGPAEADVMAGYLDALKASLEALAMKYLMSGRIEGPLRRHLTIDVHESGFPVWQEIAQTAADAAQAGDELARSPSVAAIKDDMVRQIVGDRVIPTRLQYALSQRLYYQALKDGGLFWPQMHPQGFGLAGADARRRRWLVHWAVYDSQLNMPVVYLLDVDDTGRRPLTEDAKRWPEVRAHLLAQSVTGLQLVTIAQGFDRDFDTLHPQRLRRVILGPVYSRRFTLQEGPIRQVLEDAGAPSGEDWAMALTIEDLVSERAEMETAGLFSVVERQIFKLDPLHRSGAGQGATRADRVLILPARPYQALARLDPEGFRNMRRYVPGPDGRVLAYR